MLISCPCQACVIMRRMRYRRARDAFLLSPWKCQPSRLRPGERKLKVRTSLPRVEAARASSLSPRSTRQTSLFWLVCLLSWWPRVRGPRIIPPSALLMLTTTGLLRRSRSTRQAPRLQSIPQLERKQWRPSLTTQRHRTRRPSRSSHPLRTAVLR